MPIIINFLFFDKIQISQIQTITINNRLKCYSDIYKEYGTSFIEFTKSYMNEVIYDPRYKLYNCKIYICYISFIDIVFSFNCHLSHLNFFNLRSLIISVFVATMIYHVYRACARLRIFLAHKGPGFIPNSGAGFVSWVFSMARTRRRLILIPSARNLRSLFLLASWPALRFWERCAPACRRREISFGVATLASAGSARAIEFFFA